MWMLGERGLSLEQSSHLKLEKKMATHSSILTWRISMDRGAWQAKQSMGSQESDTAEQLNQSFKEIIAIQMIVMMA